jgi:hypothetical protein
MSHALSIGSAMPIVDPDPAGIGTYLVSAVLLALGIAIFLYILFGEARAHRRPTDAIEDRFQSSFGRLIASESQGARDCQHESTVSDTPGSLRSGTRLPMTRCVSTRQWDRPTSIVTMTSLPNSPTDMTPCGIPRGMPPSPPSS